MFRMYYLSTAAPGLDAKEYEGILNKARQNNVALGVTGLLIVKGDHFVQALEGEREAVLTLFEKIKKDKRHHRVVILSTAVVEERIFGNWEMGFRDVSVSEQIPEIDLSDPQTVRDPDALDRAFRLVVEYESHV